MTGSELPGVAQACAALDDGRAVVVPNPEPMAYGIVATTARAVNALKRRPLSQNVAISLHDESQRQRVNSVIDLSSTMLDAVHTLARSRLAIVVPVHHRMRHPAWIEPAIRDGQLAIFNGYWAPTARLWEQFPRLYGSSANITGQAPASSAAKAASMFGNSCPVIDGDARSGLSARRLSSTMVRIDRTGGLELLRSGAHDATSGLTGATYLQALAESVGLTARGQWQPAAPTSGGDSEVRSR